ncbi:hypothetical protein PC9H_002115 [Pleurotus ostreatus]|uniref:Pyridoxamine 5'-phosphate oxidase N-terminal domain-containing protein n=1 Tax=Pleurotus ostreatus TaxID=5322 RepID=A0A8H7DL33_PLEOS|nr:uncharacterized protein PC9H_002115 [Pleurotus ostreatus]KAF7419524.1 hypothetical protein PC9H_002115 [Pleurotus ostreatus]KAJ8689644.1 hypothetical protein PTI98_012526 [Pleurotus ostreatus]
MGQFFEEIPENLITWILKQQMFWVSTAPLKSDGHVNVSPKGLEGSFHVVDSRRVWYEDLTGSGNETIAHLRENGRITILFNAFEGLPRIVRLFGKGTVYEYGTPEYEELLPPSVRKPGSRAVIMVDVYKVGTSCGYAVPYYDFKGHRSKLVDMSIPMQNLDRDAELALDPSTLSEPPRPKKGLKSYWAENNATSLDGLPALLYAQTSTRLFNPVSPAPKKDGVSATPKDAAKVTKGGETVATILDNLKVPLAFTLGILTATMYTQFLPKIHAAIDTLQDHVA